MINAQGPVATALFLGDPALFNTTREDCLWKRGNDRDQCPDPDITMTLFPPKNSHAKSKVNQIGDECPTLVENCHLISIKSVVFSNSKVLLDFRCICEFLQFIWKCPQHIFELSYTLMCIWHSSGKIHLIFFHFFTRQFENDTFFFD